jgi:anhydro-N-acetylmuramic acid kinase
MQPAGIIGVMSGTSLDGLDIAWCEFTFEDNHWHFEIKAAETIAYNSEWQNRLATAQYLNGLELTRLHCEYGTLIGLEVKAFIQKYRCNATHISSHGHTIFHQPHNGFTLQIGHGAYIATAAGLPVVCDFRSTDVALGGQGAPLVPIGDKLLFGEYDACLNLGGFANISYEKNGQRIAFDICAVNTVLNYLANQMGFAYDRDGLIAESGNINPQLLHNLNALDFYQQHSPRSLGIEWVKENIFPLLETSVLTIPDLLATYTAHITYVIAESIPSNSKVLITGGGAHNTYLIQQLYNIHKQLHVPDKKIIDYKEALIFAFLGMLRIHQKVNVLSTYTGASANSISGSIYLYS